jgi:hypothetical protein
LIVDQFFRRYPSEFSTTHRRWRTIEPRTLKQVKGDRLGLIVVIDLKQVFEGLHPHAQFFPNLSFKTGFQTLSGFLFSARELPVPCKMAALRPLRDEELSVFPDQTCGHVKMGFAHFFIGVP